MHIIENTGVWPISKSWFDTPTNVQMSEINCDPSCYTHQRSQKQQEQNQLSAQELVTSIHYIGGKRKRGGNLTPLYCIRLQHRKYTKENKKQWWHLFCSIAFSLFWSVMIRCFSRTSLWINCCSCCRRSCRSQTTDLSLLCINVSLSVCVWGS